MLSGFRGLTLETWFLDDAITFYDEVLDRPIQHKDNGRAVVDVGAHDLYLQEPGPVPRGGLHVHYALATPQRYYQDWVSTFETTGETWEHTFGSSRSVYTYDPDDHCVEIGDIGNGDDPIGGVFEVALEVEALDTATAFYESLGFDPVDFGDERQRVRLDGPIAVELWEPQRGIAEARGGVHTHLRFDAPDPTTVTERVQRTTGTITELESGVQLKDPDGHYLTIHSE